MNKKEIKKSLVPYVFLLVFFIGCMIMFKMFNNTVNEITYDDFIKDLNGGKVTELTITPKVRTETYKLTGKLDTYSKNESFILYIPRSEEFISKITTAKDNSNDFKLTILNDPEASSWLSVAIEVVPILILAGVTIWIFTRQIGGGNKSMDFGKSRAKLVEESRATFKDVAGLTEEKEEVQEELEKETYTPIEIMWLSPRTLNALINWDILSIEKLTKCTETKLSSIKWFGKKAMTEIRSSLAERGLKLLGDD